MIISEERMKEYNYYEIVRCNKNEIVFCDGFRIDFVECRNNWARYHNLSSSDTVCIAERYSKDNELYFVFFTNEKVKLNFKTNRILFRKKNKKEFVKMQIMINRYGYSSYDMS